LTLVLHVVHLLYMSKLHPD